MKVEPSFEDVNVSLEEDVVDVDVVVEEEGDRSKDNVPTPNLVFLGATCLKSLTANNIMLIGGGS